MTSVQFRVYWPRMASFIAKHARFDPAAADAGATPSPEDEAERRGRRRRELWLLLRVHADAFVLEPLGYLQAILWRLRGLRLRSRNRIAALAGRSPRAYALWIARTEPVVRAGQLAEPRTGTAMIIPVIDCSSGSERLELSLASLADSTVGAAPVMVGGPSVPGIDRVEHPRELAHRIQTPGSWLCVLNAGDRLSADALEIYARAAERAPDTDLIYADDDIVDGSGSRSSPHFKPSWNPELFEHHDFISGAAIVRVDPARLAQLPAERWAKLLIEEAVGRGDPVHLPAVLHHRRSRPTPLRPVKPKPVLPDPAPSVTAIIPTRNGVELLKTCIAGVKRTDYPKVDVIVVDNGSDEPAALSYLAGLRAAGIQVLEMPGRFNFSALNNAAVQHAQGELLCFLNNDVEMIDPDWLALLVRQALRPGRGAVGARLLYPDGKVQHAGVIIGVGGGAGHAHRLQPQDEPGYFDRAALPQRVSAVTAACMVVAREKFEAVGGFDETDFPVAFNDVDLCMKLNARGWQSFYEPRATLIHHESQSRGLDRDKVGRVRLAAELAALKRKWHTDERRDPYHHAQLSPFCEQFVIAV